MKQISILALVACLSTAPALAQEAEDGDISEGLSLMEQGALLLFRGMMDEVEPAIEDFSGMAEDLEPTLRLLATEMGPALVELFETVDSIRYYDAPEFLPNGDIIMRRKPNAPDFTPPAAEPEEIDL